MIEWEEGVKKVLVDDIDLINIAYNIRNLNNTTTLYTPSEMSTVLNDIYNYYKSLLDRTATKVLFPYGLSSIGANAFSGCANLTQVTIPNNIISIGENAFSGCENLTTINIYGSEGEIAGAPWGATNATIHYNYKESTEPTIVQIVSPFDFQIKNIEDSNGIVVEDPEKMRLSTMDIIVFTKDVTIDMSGYNAMYVPYLYSADGSYTEGITNWRSTSTILEVPANTGVRIKLRNNNYELWTDDTIEQVSSAIKITGMGDVEIYTVEDKGKYDITFRVGYGFTSSTMDVTQGDSRITATQASGIKRYPSSKSLLGVTAYPITIPADATKIKVTCPNFINGLVFLTYEDGNYVVANDVGWQTLNEGEYSFTAGEYGYVAINFKNSLNSTIPTDTDTSAFSIIFE